jgi:hypothetical protein
MADDTVEKKDEKSGIPTVESRYDQLASDRIAYLNRAYDCSEITIPSLLPRNGHNPTMVLPTPYQSVGARGTNNLSSKLLMALFPPNTPFFKLQMDQTVINQMEQEQGEDGAQNLTTQFGKAFSKIERVAMSDIEVSGDRVVLFEALKHVIVCGNSLLHQAKEGLRAFPLSQYVVRRDAAGNVLEIILCEEVDPIVLPEYVREVMKANKTYANKKSHKLYTYICRKEKKWITYQEACGTKITETIGSYPLDRCPWIPLRFTRINGEDYGRGYVEEYMGDFVSLENLTAAIVQGSAAASKVLFLVKPNSSTKVTVLAKTPNGGFASGNAEDVTVLRLEKAQDFATAKALRDDFIQQLSFAFLMNTAIQRDAERVTAEEVRYMAQELEQTLGGFYSIMSIELQLPYVNVKLDSLQRLGKLPRLPKGTVRPAIVTGLEALGRGNDRDKLVRYIKTAFEVMTPQVAVRYLNPTELLDRLAVADGIDTKNLLRSQEDIDAEAQQQQQQALIEKLGPGAMSAVSGMAKEGIKANGQQQAAAAGQSAGQA